MDKTTLYLPSDLRQALQEAAKQSGRPQADLIREALRAYLTRLHRPSPRSIGAGDDEGLSGRESEAWLTEHWKPRADA